MAVGIIASFINVKFVALSSTLFDFPTKTRVKVLAQRQTVEHPSPAAGP
jgi:hypothetical protein